MLLLDQWSSKWESGPPWGLQLHFRGFVKSWVQPSWNLVLCTFNVTSSHEIITLRTQSYPIFPVLVQLCQWGMHCILWWGGSHKDLFKIREHPSPYLEASLWMHQCWKVVFGGGGEENCLKIINTPFMLSTPACRKRTMTKNRIQPTLFLAHLLEGFHIKHSHVYLSSNL